MQVSTIDQMQIRNKLKNRHAGVTGVGVNRLRAVAVVEEQEEEDVQLQSPPPPQSSSSSFSSKTVVQQLKDDQRKELLALQKQIKNLQERINELYGPEDSRDVEEDKKEEVEATARDTTNIDTNTSSSAAKESSFQQQRQQALDDDLDVSTEALRTQHGYTSPACTLQFDDYIDNDIGEEDDDLPVFDRIFFLHMRKAGGSRYVFVSHISVCNQKFGLARVRLRYVWFKLISFHSSLCCVTSRPPSQPHVPHTKTHS